MPIATQNTSKSLIKHTTLVPHLQVSLSSLKQPLVQSYLRGDKIIEVAQNERCEAVHPGFGFLSENADFAEHCAREKIIFVGPPSSAIKAMGSKSESKRIMTDAKVPVVPGYHGDQQADEYLMEEARKIGFPVLIKAVMGGGGKGMRIVRHEKEFIEQLHSARRESAKAFKDDRVLVEKYIERPKHIEVQVFGDKHGNYVYLFERDCSIQRRHQKVVEEAPSSLNEDLRGKLGKSAIDAARAVGYYNAGTVEFIFDLDSQRHYFMEMNTRLQVEHPITEMITGQDLVEWQLRVASGERLPLRQDQLRINGHSIEARVYAEDPYNNFLPGNGRLSYLSEPTLKEGRVRLESGVREGDEISIFYDPMIAKLVTWGETREAAVREMSAALANYRIYGPATNLKFLRTVLNHNVFQDWKYDIGYIGRYASEILAKTKGFAQSEILRAVVAHVLAKRKQIQSEGIIPSTLLNFRVNVPLVEEFTVSLHSATIDPHEIHLNCVVSWHSAQAFDLKVTEVETKKVYQFDHLRIAETSQRSAAFSDTNGFYRVNFAEVEGRFLVFGEDHNNIEVVNESEKVKTGIFEESAEAAKKAIRSPMPATVVKLLVKEGDAVTTGMPLIILEAMKMEHVIKAPRDGVIKSVTAREGVFVDASTSLLLID
eukprot:TRINITY_DN2637_c0_g1_i2.p1 TRINITY_DN2637_c0_g1~~TRINITY_DN2637_c0_g1_i2.p1  ORF type:complete len:655 (+),score=201.36 TRINITY_DN2637_c0_g1_i2:229-2193(+)